VLAPLTSFVARDAIVYSITTWDHYVAWAGGDSEASNPNRIALYDLDTRITRVIARSSWNTGEIDWVRGSRGTIVYTELARIPSDEDPNVPWRVFAVDISTGRKRQIAASKRPSDEILQPFPSIEWPWIVDISPPSKPSTETADIVSYDLRDGRRLVLVPSGHPGSVTIDHGLVFYGEITGGQQDLFVVPVDGSGKPRRLTTSGRVALPKAANGGVTWQEPPQGDPDSLWYMPTNPLGSPIQFAQGGSNAFPGQGFVLWYTVDGRLVASDPLDAREPTVLDSPDQTTGSIPSLPAKWWTFGDRAAWVSDIIGDLPTATIHIGLLRRG
jgi:hypothetical protein